ncbi:TolC family protein [Gimesia algae]|uniref:Outer membrane efflux protein n=1 Tax=Gimesia algae TaxID=2527971 RepID=A0A517VI60_9PLAN|nr:TolC family protein [Gimesia algae]QDT92667.1 Outer membrane efflux protein [Gimesia algae]
MKDHPLFVSCGIGLLCSTILVAGCASHTTTVQKSSTANAEAVARTSIGFDEPVEEQHAFPEQIVQTGAETVDEKFADGVRSELVIQQSPLSQSLGELEMLAVDQNPRLVKLYREYNAASSRSRYVNKLPDPKVGTNVFGAPIQTASGSQRAVLSASQAIPWLGKLDAEEQRACFEAFAVRADYLAERLRVIAAVRTGWYRLYVIDQQIQTAKANQQLLQSLIDVANAQITTGTATQGDVLLGTLELSKLEERLLTYRKLRVAVQAEVNRLVARDADLPIVVPVELEISLPVLSAQEIYETTLRSQPEIQAAQLRTQASRWGIEVAHLSRRPELTVSANYFFTDNNRPASSLYQVGQDPWSLGAQVSIPLWRDKYDALEDEATWKHLASTDNESELRDRYDALITELLAEARRADETAKLYQNTILPQARQTLRADQESYSRGAVEFDRVIRDYRNLLTLELGYHSAVGELAVSLAQLSRVAGQDVELAPVPALPERPQE